jgi:hypothetical protein
MVVIADQHAVEVIQLVLNHPRPETCRTKAPPLAMKVVASDPDALWSPYVMIWGVGVNSAVGTTA